MNETGRQVRLSSRKRFRRRQTRKGWCISSQQEAVQTNGTSENKQLLCTFFSCFQVVHTTASLAARLIRPVKSGNTRNTHAKEPVDSRPCSLSLKSLLTRAGAFCMTDPVWHGIFVFSLSLIPRCCCAQEFSKQVQTPDAKQITLINSCFLVRLIVDLNTSGLWTLFEFPSEMSLIFCLYSPYMSSSSTCRPPVLQLCTRERRDCGTCGEKGPQ